MLRSLWLLAAAMLVSISGVMAQENLPDDALWHADRPAPVAIYRDLSGNPTKPGKFRYYYQAPAGASIAAHRHSVAMSITVRSGRKFILMGDLDNARVQRFDAGSSFTIPAHTWHVEWWETDTVEEIEGTGPMQTEEASPKTPRQSSDGLNVDKSNRSDVSAASTRGPCAMDYQPKSADEAELVSIELDWCDAAIKRDATRLSAVFADDLIWTENDKFTDKSGVMRRYMLDIQEHLWEQSDVKIRVEGDIAVVISRIHVVKTVDGKTTDSSHTSNDVFRKRGGRWQLIVE